MKVNPLDILLSTRYTEDREPERGQVIISIENECIATLQNFITISAIEKGGKGKFIAPIVAGAIAGKEVYGISTRLPAERKRVGLFDTEQGDYNFYKSILNIKRLTELDSLPAHFDAYKLRKCEPFEILPTIEAYLKAYPDCALVAIDGLIDLIYSINDEIKCAVLVKQLMNLTEIYNCCIIAALHRSKSAGNTIGHLGSFANRKAQSVLIVEKNKDGTITMKGEFLRDSAGFTPIQIFYNRNFGTWDRMDYIADEEKGVFRMKKPKPRELDKEIHETNVRRIFYPEAVQKYSDLVDGIAEMYACGQNWAKDCVPHLISEGLIFKVPGGYTNSREQKLRLGVVK